MTFLIDPIKEFVYFPSIVARGKPYAREDVKEWLPTLFKTMTAAGYFFISRTFVHQIVDKIDYRRDNSFVVTGVLMMQTGGMMMQHGSHAGAFWVAQGYFNMLWGAELLIKGFPKRDTVYLIGGSLLILAGILGLDYANYHKNEYKKSKKDDLTFCDSVLDYHYNKIAHAMTTPQDTNAWGSTKKV
jgi:hypothetical protein